MKIAFIYPTTLDDNQNPVKYKKSFFPPLILALLSGLTPSKHTIKTYNDFVEDIDFSEDFDLVGITAMTSQAYRAYQIADRFRELRVKVIIGGVHAYFLPDEVKKHADSILLGESENIWEQVLIDAENNSLKEVYQDSSFPDLQNLLIPDWKNVNFSIYPKAPGNKLPLIPIYATRGCPNGCKFCSVTKYFGKSYRIKPISHVLKEIESINAERFFFVDDNIACRPDYSRELFKALSRKNITWLGQVSTKIVKHPDLIELAAKAGCDMLFIGMETINRKNLLTVNKNFNQIEKYEELIAMLRNAGIHPYPGFIFGFDYDTLETFDETFKFLEKNKINFANFYPLTPLPGTDLFKELDENGRILHYDWSKYDQNTILIQPKNFTVNDFYKYFWKTYQKWYSLKNILKRQYSTVAISRKPVATFFENLFYQFLFRQAVMSYLHANTGGIRRMKQY